MTYKISQKFKFFIGSLKFSSALILMLIIINSTNINLTQAQMTFSDGWGKRSSPPVAVAAATTLEKASSNTNDKETLKMGPITLPNGNNNVLSILKAIKMAPEEDRILINAALESCTRAYTSTLYQVHNQIMRIYEKYDSCQKKALLLPTTDYTSA